MMGTLKDELKKWKNVHQKSKSSPQKRKNKKKSNNKEKHIEGFWKEMMGMGRPRYERRGGALRQK